MTHQEMFNLAYLGLEAQGFRQAGDSKNGCQYKTKDGLRCAVGWITEGLEQFAGAVQGPKISKFLKDKGVINSDEDVYFLAKLQQAHDSGLSSEILKQNLESFALSHNLTIPTEPAEPLEVLTKESATIPA